MLNHGCGWSQCPRCSPSPPFWLSSTLQGVIHFPSVRLGWATSPLLGYQTPKSTYAWPQRKRKHHLSDGIPNTMKSTFYFMRTATLLHPIIQNNPLQNRKAGSAPVSVTTIATAVIITATTIYCLLYANDNANHSIYFHIFIWVLIFILLSMLDICPVLWVIKLRRNTVTCLSSHA